MADIEKSRKDKGLSSEESREAEADGASSGSGQVSLRDLIMSAGAALGGLDEETAESSAEETSVAEVVGDETQEHDSLKKLAKRGSGKGKGSSKASKRKKNPAEDVEWNAETSHLEIVENDAVTAPVAEAKSEMAELEEAAPLEAASVVAHDAATEPEEDALSKFEELARRIAATVSKNQDDVEETGAQAAADDAAVAAVVEPVLEDRTVEADGVAEIAEFAEEVPLEETAQFAEEPQTLENVVEEPIVSDSAEAASGEIVPVTEPTLPETALDEVAPAEAGSLEAVVVTVEPLEEAASQSRTGKAKSKRKSKKAAKEVEAAAASSASEQVEAEQDGSPAGFVDALANLSLAFSGESAASVAVEEEAGESAEAQELVSEPGFESESESESESELLLKTQLEPQLEPQADEFPQAQEEGPEEVTTAAELTVVAAIDESANEEENDADPEPVEFIEHDQLLSIIESLLFSTDKPVSIATIKQIFKGTNVRTKDITRALDLLASDYASSTRGVTLEDINGGYQLRTKSDNADYLKRLAKTRPFRLSGPALEVMAIVAYKQPVTKHEIDEIRGVESGHLLRALMERNLVSFAGKAENMPGKPMAYGTTRKFLETFGLRNLKELPTLAEIDELLPEGIGEVEEKETLSDLTDRLSTEITGTYSEGEEELNKINEQLQQIDTTSEFFEQEKQRERDRRDRERAQDIRERIVLGDNVDEKDRRWLDRYEAKLHAQEQALASGEPVVVSADEMDAEPQIGDQLQALSAESASKAQRDQDDDELADVDASLVGGDEDDLSVDDMTANADWDEDHESGKDV